MTSFFNIYFTIKTQYKFAIFCEYLKILCRVVSAILDRTTYWMTHVWTIHFSKFREIYIKMVHSECILIYISTTKIYMKKCLTIYEF